MSTSKQDQPASQVNPAADLVGSAHAVLRPGVSKSKLAKAMNRLLYRGDLEGLRKVVSENRRLAQACLPYMASSSYRETVLAVLNERR